METPVITNELKHIFHLIETKREGNLISVETAESILDPKPSFLGSLKRESFVELFLKIATLKYFSALVKDLPHAEWRGPYQKGDIITKILAAEAEFLLLVTLAFSGTDTDLLVRRESLLRRSLLKISSEMLSLTTDASLGDGNGKWKDIICFLAPGPQSLT